MSLPQRWGLDRPDVLHGLLTNLARRVEMRHRRFLVAYSPICTQENPRLVVLATDGSRHRSTKSQDHQIQKSRYNSHYGGNVDTKLECKFACTSESHIVMFTPSLHGLFQFATHQVSLSSKAIYSGRRYFFISLSQNEKSFPSANKKNYKGIIF